MYVWGSVTTQYQHVGEQLSINYNANICQVDRTQVDNPFSCLLISLQAGRTDTCTSKQILGHIKKQTSTDDDILADFLGTEN